MVHGVVMFGKRAVPIDYRARIAGSRERFNDRVRLMADDLEFRRQWKKVSKVELWSSAAILQFNDGTKWYLNIS